MPGGLNGYAGTDIMNHSIAEGNVRLNVIPNGAIMVDGNAIDGEWFLDGSDENGDAEDYGLNGSVHLGDNTGIVAVPSGTGVIAGTCLTHDIFVEHTEGDCTTPGTTTCKCGVCGEEVTVMERALGAHHDQYYAFDDDAHWLICPHCGEIEEAEAHNYGEWTVEGNIMARECADCGHIQASVIPNPGNDAAVGHDDEEYTVDDGNDADGSKASAVDETTHDDGAPSDGSHSNADGTVDGGAGENATVADDANIATVADANGNAAVNATDTVHTAASHGTFANTGDDADGALAAAGSAGLAAIVAAAIAWVVGRREEEE